MGSGIAETPFSVRFDQACGQLRRVQVWLGIAWTSLGALLGFALLVALDYAFELPWTVRALVLALLCTVAIVSGSWRIVGTLRWWSQPRTAKEIEQRFPQLGQRIRTVVQFAGRSEAATMGDGVALSLLTALEQETDVKTRPIDLGVVIPWRRLATAALLAGIPLLLFVVLGVYDQQWRVALQRAVLKETPYTRLVVAPGDITVDQADDVRVSLRVAGRLPSDIAVESRPALQTEAVWSQHEVTVADDNEDDHGDARYQTTLESVEGPIEYRVVAGSTRSPTYQVDVRYPFSIEKFDVVLTPPAYTGVAPTIVSGGDFEGIDGSDAELRLTLDSACSQAYLLVRQADDESSPDGDKSVRRISMQVDGSSLSGHLQLRNDLFYSLAAVSADGRQLPENQHRVIVRKDQPPQVRFAEPEDIVEVHPLAEVLMRLRVSDDFGLTKTGIVFQVNDGEQRTLLAEEFDQANGADLTPEELKRKQQMVLEKKLALEELSLTPTESVTYFAFAEDNRPSGVQRFETDLRFIDIRSFKRNYLVGGT